MLNDSSGALKLVLSVFFFPLFFQESFLSFGWSGHGALWMVLSRRIFLLLPIGTIILGCWVTGLCLLTVVVRHKRIEYLTSLLVTWWDLGKAIFHFWGGILKFTMYLIVTVFTFIRLLAIGAFMFIADLLLLPFQIMRKVGENAFGPGIPWIAVGLTMVWTLLEATIFTFVTSSMVIETLESVTGSHFSEKLIRFPLFLFMFFIVLGSYSVLLNLAEAISTKNISAIVKIGMVELVAVFVEVVFLYREFVDALVPWFAQHSAGFELGVVGTLAIATCAWLGIRSLSWFLFASHGTPLIMGIIQGRGYKVAGVARPSGGGSSDKVEFKLRSLEQIKNEFSWIEDKGDELLGAVLLPPLQLIAASINFCVLLMTSQHLFDLPLKDMSTVANLRPKLRDVQASKGAGKE